MNTISIQATGRRKNAIATLSLTTGSGNILINARELKAYFGNHTRHIHRMLKPLKVSKSEKKYDITIKAVGGGISGQVDAISLAIARALIKVDPSLKPTLKKEGLLTRDPRMVERKKPGKPKARKRFQYSKR